MISKNKWTILFIYFLPYFLFAQANDFIIFSEDDQELTSCYGTIVDDGGLDGNYADDFEGRIIINSPSGGPITVTFLEYEILNSDLLEIYDGYSEFTETPNLIAASFNDNFDNLTLTINSGILIIDFESDFFTNDYPETLSGFEIYYEAAPFQNPTVADFSYEITDLVANFPIPFTNLSENYWLFEWNYGELDTTNENPYLSFTEPGFTEVVLTAYGCMDTATSTQNVFIPSYPNIEWDIDSISYRILQNDSLNHTLVLENSGGPFRGVTPFSKPETINVLLLGRDVLYGSDSTYLKMHLPEYFTFSYASKWNVKNLLDLKRKVFEENIHIIVAQDDEDIIYTGIEEYLAEFVAAGGGLILNRFSSEFNHFGFLEELDDDWSFGEGLHYPILVENHPITNLLEDSTNLGFVSGDYRRAISVNDSDFIPILNNNEDKTIIGYKNIGKGKIVFDGSFNIHESGSPDIFNGEFSLALSIKYASFFYTPNWLSCSANDTLAITQQEKILEFTINTENTKLGNHHFDLQIYNNDSVNGLINIPIDISVERLVETGFSVPDPSVCDGEIQFVDETLFNPHTWFWDFGDGKTSMESSPNHIYEESGVYNVTLITCNDWGCDTLSKQDFIRIDYNGAFCDTISFITFQHQDLYNLCSGVLSLDEITDEPLEFDIYSTITLHNSSGGNMRLSFGSDEDLVCNHPDNIYGDEFDYCGGINLYNGTTITEEPNFSLHLSQLSNLVYNSNQSEVTLEFYGLKEEIVPNLYIEIDILDPDEMPIAEFFPQDTTGFFNFPIQFFNESINSGHYYWNFGDGTTSQQHNPSHIYTNSGFYDVSLIAGNCLGYDTTIYENLIIPEAAQADWNPDQIELTLYVGDTLTQQIEVISIANKLALKMQPIENEEPIEEIHLLFTDDTNYRLVDSLKRVFPNVSFIKHEYIDLDHNFVRQKIQEFGIKFLIFAEHYGWQYFDQVFQEFVEQGGKLLIMSPDNLNYISNNSGILAVETGFEATYDHEILNITEKTSYPITDSLLINNQVLPKQYYSILFNDKDYVSLVNTENEYSVLGYKYLGEGIAFYVSGRDIGSQNDGAVPIMNDLLERTIKYLINSNENDWLSIDSDVQVLDEGTSEELNLFFDARTKPPGIYEYNLNIITNSAENAEIVIPVELTVLSKLQTDFSFLKNNSCKGIWSFHDETEQDVNCWEWDFGDGGVSSLQKTTHPYQLEGNYTVTLTTCNGIDCNTISKEVYVEESATVAFYLPNPLGVDHQAVFSFDLFDEEVRNVSWDFGNGETSQKLSPKITYDIQGEYQVSLNVETTQNCNYIFTQSISVIERDTNPSRFQNDFYVHIFPNPAYNLINLECYNPLENLSHLEIYNPSGKLCFQEKIKNATYTTQIDVSNWISGLYFVKWITLNDEAIIQKFIIQ